MSEPFEDSRRLTGANLYFDGAGAALESARGVAFDAQVLQRWRDHVERMREALGWPQGDVVVRTHASGVSLAFAAPIDQLYTAVEANEWAWHAALGLRASDKPVVSQEGLPRAHVAHLEVAAALLQLQQLAASEAKPVLVALIGAAKSRGVPAHADDDALSLGEGASSRTWPLDAMPGANAVPWTELRGIPKAIVTGSNGKTTTVRLIAAMLREHGLRCGYSSTDGLVVDGQCIDAGDYSGPVGARTVLRHPRVQAAVLEAARGGLLRRGLVVDDALVAVVTNVSADHFGEYGVHTLDDIAAVKLVVAKALDASGVLLLNADDAQLVRRADSLEATRIGWFAGEFATARARAPLACGVRNGRLWLADDGGEHDLGDIRAMPLTLGGSARYNVQNIAGAALAGHVLGVATGCIGRVLARFGDGPGDNPGRLQRWVLGNATHSVQVLLDYAHNPEGLQGLLEVAADLRAGGRLGLILGQAGNRGDDDIRQLAATAAQARPDRVWLKDIGGEYMRGRAPGEIAAILFGALRASGMPASALPVCLDEARAAREALQWARPGDLLVLPVHQTDAREAVVGLLNHLQDSGWRAGAALPADD